MAELRDDPEFIAEAKRWQRKLAEGGWGAITWPKAFGGREAGPLEVMAFAEEIAAYDVPQSVFLIGLGMMGPTIIAHGSEEQHRRYLPPMLSGEEIWCQLWSEPDAGSDLASLKTRAEPDGDEFVLNGQKVWTSGAQYCQFGLGIFRTDPDVPKHKGISCFVVPMDTPGITVRPLRQMTGRRPLQRGVLRRRAGAGGQSRRRPQRRMAGRSHDADARAHVGRDVDLVRRGVPDARVARPFPCDRRPGCCARGLARVYSQARLFDLTTARVRNALEQGGIPGAEASILKLAATLLLHRPGRTSAPSCSAPEACSPTAARPRTADGPTPCSAASPCTSVEAPTRSSATSSERPCSSFPREPAVDRDIPFRDLRAGTIRIAHNSSASDELWAIGAIGTSEPGVRRGGRSARRPPSTRHGRRPRRSGRLRARRCDRRPSRSRGGGSREQ